MGSCVPIRSQYLGKVTKTKQKKTKNRRRNFNITCASTNLTITVYKTGLSYLDRPKSRLFSHLIRLIGWKSCAENFTTRRFYYVSILYGSPVVRKKLFFAPGILTTRPGIGAEINKSIMGKRSKLYHFLRANSAPHLYFRRDRVASGSRWKFASNRPISSNFPQTCF